MSQTYESRILDHLGLVAGMCDELGLSDWIDGRIAQDTEQRTVSVGQAVKAMILNGLGFTEQRLYLTPQFFATKPTERLVGAGIKPEHLNDDALGRALDALYDYGITELFRDLAAHAAARLELTPRFVHLDATSFHVDGTYNSEAPEPEEGVVHIRKGYSRDHRPGLNQVVLDLMVEHQAGLPVLMEPLSGNASDQGSFPELIDRHLSHLQNAHGFEYVVADSALYSADHIRRLHEAGTKFITRVPETIVEARQVLRDVDVETMEPLTEGYRAVSHDSEYGGAEQRWLIVYSEAAEARARRRGAQVARREHETEEKTLRELETREFACRADAMQALEAFEADLTASVLIGSRVLREVHVALGADGELIETGTITYGITGLLAPDPARKADLTKQKSLFIIATNEGDEKTLSAVDLLEAYKGQHAVERGFRFLKDPQFLASTLYLKSERRIMALLMVMTLCLLVYAALQYRIRQGLKEAGQSYPDQKGSPTQRPTARWIFQSFVGIHVLHAGSQHLVLNLNEHHQTVISVLGPSYEQLYVSHPT